MLTFTQYNNRREYGSGSSAYSYKESLHEFFSPDYVFQNPAGYG